MFINSSIQIIQFFRDAKRFFDLFQRFFNPHASKFHHYSKDDLSKRTTSYSALSRSVSELPVIGFVRTGSPAVAVA